MIQLRRASFKNFRLLRDIDIEFSTDPSKPLTVVRAENDTGKTTLLNALNWGLFGDPALPGGRSSFRLHPIDWDTDNDDRDVKITVSIEFATSDEETGAEAIYELERSCTERLTDDINFSTEQSSLSLFKHTGAGITPIENPTATIESILPASLRDVFFIDGDRALAFIEATDEQRVKRERVARAVRSLLGLDLLEDSERHVDKARQEAVSTIRRLGVGTDVERLAAARQKFEEEEQKLRDFQTQCRNDLDATEGRHRKADKRLKDALAAGAGEHREMGVKLETAEKSLKSEREEHKQLLEGHRRLLNSSSLVIALAPTPIQLAAGLLADLEERKVIPSTLPNVIEDRLMREECICGNSLAHGTAARTRLEKLLEESRDIDESKDLLRSLNDSVKRTQREFGVEENWTERLRKSQANVLRSEKRQGDLEDEVADLRARIRGTESTSLEELERSVTQEEREIKRLHLEKGRNDQQLRELEAKIKEVDRDRQTAEKTNAKVRSGVMNETAAKDILDVIRTTIGVLQGETIDEVSEKMNEIFLSMIIADADAGSVVRKAILTRENDIVVEGPGGRTIDPDIDLNGASRRALTLAFILALVKVSGVNAPNIIDTPLGMMGIEVRQAVLKYAAENSSQLIMFLTGSEILGVENLIDEYAGRVYTFTNSAHYPSKLVNDPMTDRIETLVCNCDHRHTCQLCRRRASLDYVEKARVAS